MVIDWFLQNKPEEIWLVFLYPRRPIILPHPILLPAFCPCLEQGALRMNCDYCGMTNKITEFVQCEAVQFGRSVTKFKRNLLPTPFRLKKNHCCFQAAESMPRFYDFQRPQYCMRLYFPEGHNLKTRWSVMYLIAQQVNTATNSVAFGTFVLRIQTEISCHANSPRPASLLKEKYKDSSRLLHWSSL